VLQRWQHGPNSHTCANVQTRPQPNTAVCKRFPWNEADIVLRLPPPLGETPGIQGKGIKKEVHISTQLFRVCVCVCVFDVSVQPVSNLFTYLYCLGKVYKEGSEWGDDESLWPTNETELHKGIYLGGGGLYCIIRGRCFCYFILIWNVWGSFHKTKKSSQSQPTHWRPSLRRLRVLHSAHCCPPLFTQPAGWGQIRPATWSISHVSPCEHMSLTVKCKQ